MMIFVFFANQSLIENLDLQEMIEYGRQQQRSLIQQREQMMNEIRKESTQLNKEFEKKNQELTNTLKNEVTQYMTTNLAPM
jgi:recombinational DNA repair ATPase RecF